MAKVDVTKVIAASVKHSKALQEQYRKQIQDAHRDAEIRSDSDHAEPYKAAKQEAEQHLAQLKQGGKGGYAEVMMTLIYASYADWAHQMDKKWDRWRARSAAEKNVPWESSSPYSIEMDDKGNITKLLALDNRNPANLSKNRYQGKVSETFVKALTDWAKDEPKGTPKGWELKDDGTNIFFQDARGNKVKPEQFITEKNNPDSSFHSFLKTAFKKNEIFKDDLKLTDNSKDALSQQLNQRPPVPRPAGM